MDKDVFKKLPTCSQYFFFSKVIERVARFRHSYLEENLLMPSIQSAYRKYHSIENPSQLRVTNEVRYASDSFHWHIEEVS